MISYTGCSPISFFPLSLKDCWRTQRGLLADIPRDTERRHLRFRIGALLAWLIRPGRLLLLLRKPSFDLLQPGRDNRQLEGAGGPYVPSARNPLWKMRVRPEEGVVTASRCGG